MTTGIKVRHRPANVEPLPSSACEPPRLRHFYLFGFDFVVDLNRISRSAKQRVE